MVKLVGTPVAPFDGFGFEGAFGGEQTPVVNDHVGPSLE